MTKLTVWVLSLNGRITAHLTRPELYERLARYWNGRYADHTLRDDDFRVLDADDECAEGNYDLEELERWLSAQFDQAHHAAVELDLHVTAEVRP